jgi:hypothetical protein
MPPVPTPQPNVDELFLLFRSDTGGRAAANLRPDSLWIGRLPTFDVNPGTWTYSPLERRPTNLSPSVQGALTITEYRDYFAHLPREDASYEQTKASWRSLLKWAEADPRRRTLYPVAMELCAARVNLEAAEGRNYNCPL